MFYIYILHSSNSNIYYVGYSSDFISRVYQHNTSDRDTFSKKHRPWILKAVFEAGGDKRKVVKIERFIKKQKSKKLIERMINGDELHAQLAQLVRVPYVRD